MIVSKKDQPKEPLISPSGGVDEIQVTNNALEEVFNAVKKVLSSLHEDPYDNASPLIFNTIKMDNGQFDRITKNGINTEYAIRFPAVFIHFINVRYLIQQQRIGEGRATLRIRFILNRLNNSDEGFECEGYKIFERINTAIQDAKSTEKALNERCNLTYFDQPLSCDNGLQSYWIDYEIWFRETSSWKYRKYVDRYLVVPPFTNHSDQEDKNNTEHHPDHKDTDYGHISNFKPSVSPDSDTEVGGGEGLPSENQLLP